MTGDGLTLTAKEPVEMYNKHNSRWLRNIHDFSLNTVTRMGILPVSNNLMKGPTVTLAQL